MKNRFSRIICLLAVFSIILVSLFAIPAFADSATISINKKTINVGDTVTVTVKYNSELPLIVATGSLSYNSSVLQYVSGADSNPGSSVNFYKELSGQKSTTATVTFKAIAEGSSSLGLKFEGSDGNAKNSATAGATANVTTPAPSSNANLASLKVSEGSLSPAFNAKTTEYNVMIKSGVSKFTIQANAADGKSTVVGAGTFNIKEGDNKYTLTVTAASGAKKSYNITAHLMTKEETEAFVEAQRAADPSLVIIDNKDYHIASDLTGIEIPTNFTAASADYKGATIATFTDSANAYNICYLKSDDGTDANWFVINEDETFSNFPYIFVKGEMYIVKTDNKAVSPSEGWYKSDYKLIDGTKVVAYKNDDTRLSDFLVFYCYYNGEEQFYRFDKATGTIQRYPDFEAIVTTDTEVKSQNFLERFKNLSKTGKATVILFIAAIICVIVLLVLFIIFIANRSKETDEVNSYYADMPTDDFDMISLTDTEDDSEETIINDESEDE